MTCVAATTLALALPATAAASTSGGAVAPDSTAAASTATGGVVPSTHTAGREADRAKPATHHKRKKKSKKHKKKHAKPPKSPPSGSGSGSDATGPGAADVPSDYLRLYRAAGSAYGVDWRILAAIGKNESDHGRSTLRGIASGVNFAGCCSGPMQMCTTSSCGNTWSHYAVDADGDGKTSVYEPADAIYAAAGLVADLRAMFGDHPAYVLAGYNAGPGNVQRYHGVPPFAETQSYVEHGLAYMSSLGSG